MRRFVLLLSLVFIAGLATNAGAQDDVSADDITINNTTVTDICPGTGIQNRTANFQPGGIILTAFDKTGIWLYSIDLDTRYPLPDTVPCSFNCNLSPDGRWLTYFNDLTNAYYKMRLDGTERTLLVENANEVSWWNPETLLVWTPGHEAYLQPEDSTERTPLNVDGVTTLQPGGYWGILLEQDGDDFRRTLINTELRGLNGVAQQQVDLGIARPYFEAAAWSPSGEMFAYVGDGSFDESVGTAGGELFIIRPGGDAPTRMTDLTTQYGAVRINGLAIGELSWSPDSSKIAFWVTELLGADPTANTGNAVLHILDVNTGETRSYCGYSTTEHTPNTPRLRWSPDSTAVAFGGNIPDDERGYLLLALNVESGVFTVLSTGIYPVLGTADLIAWGLPPR